MSTRNGLACGFLWQASLVTMAVALTACGSTSSITCPDGEPPFAVQVRLHDAVGDSIVPGPVLGVVEDGDYSDSLRAFGYDGEWRETMFGAGRGRPGTYSVLVRREGFLDVSRSNVQAISGACGVVPVVVMLELQPVP